MSTTDHALIKKGIIKIKGRIPFSTKAKSGAKHHNSKTEQRIRAKAAYLSSGGRKDLKDIARELGVSTSSVSKWRTEGDWDRDLSVVERTVREKVQTQLVNSKEVQGLFKDVTDEQLTKVVEQMVGPTVADQVAKFLVSIHKEDLKDISSLNRALRMKLTDDKIEYLTPKEIGELVGAKTNLIKMVRLIMGQTTENDGGNNGPTEININIEKGSDLEQSLVTIGAVTKEGSQEMTVEG